MQALLRHLGRHAGRAVGRIVDDADDRWTPPTFGASGGTGRGPAGVGSAPIPASSGVTTLAPAARSARALL